MDPTLAGIIITSITTIVVSVTTVLLTQYFSRKRNQSMIKKDCAVTEKTNVETAVLIADEWEGYAQELKKQVSNLKAESEKWKSELEKVNVKVNELSAELQDLKKRFQLRNKALVDLLQKVWYGINVLLLQLGEHNLSPDWCPDKGLAKQVEHQLQEAEKNGRTINP